MARPKKTQTKDKAPKALTKAPKEFVEPLVPQPIQVSKHKSVNQIFGFKLAKYKTDDEKTYLAEIQAMNRIDLQRECSRVELHPSDNRVIMIERLIKQFRIYTASTKAPPSPVVMKVGRRSRDILSRIATPLV